MIARTFAGKIFLAITLACAASTGLICLVIYHSWAERNREEFIRRYEIFSNELSITLTLMEATTDKLMMSAVRHLAYLIDKEGVPSNKKLEALAQRYGVTDFFVTDKVGDFARWTNRHNLPKSILTFCSGYSEFLKRGDLIEQTPVIFSPQGPSKFTAIPLHEKGGGIIESGMRVEYLGEALAQAAQADGNALSVELFTPSGQPLGRSQKEEPMPESPPALEKVFEKNEYVIGPDQSTFYSKVSSNCDTCCECKEKNSVDKDGKYYYVLKTTVSSKPLVTANAQLRTKIILIYLMVFLAVLFLSKYLAGRLVSRLNHVAETLKTIDRTKDLSIRLNDSSPDEIGSLSRVFDSMANNLASAQQALVQQERDRAIAESARQVAHDIRSPLSALQVGCQNLEGVPENISRIMRLSIDRIKDIANNLSHPLATHSLSGDTSQVCLVSSLLESVISEKRLQYRHLKDLPIELEFVKDSLSVFALVEPHAFKRSVSNLIDNAIEATDDLGKVSITLKATPKRAFIHILDIGRGIPAGYLGKIGTQGLTIGKPNGSGLGLHYAKKAIEKCEGRLRLSSKLGRGTRVSLSLPRAKGPSWFAGSIDLARFRNVVIVDDDRSMHEAWASILKPADSTRPDFIVHCTSPEELRSQLENHPEWKSDSLFLVDYHFTNSSENGIEAIRSLGIAPRSILVTSHAEETALIDRCNKAQVKILPKGLIGWIPILGENTPHA